MSIAISLIEIVTSSGTARPGPVLVLGMVFWYLLVTVAPFLVGVLATPNTYPKAGFRRGTATQVPRDPGQPRIGIKRGLNGVAMTVEYRITPCESEGSPGVDERWFDISKFAYSDQLLEKGTPWER